MAAFTSIFALLVLSPLVWCMQNENTALVKTLATAVGAAFVLAAVGPAELWRGFRDAWPAHVLVLLAAAGAALSPSPSFSVPAALLAGTLWLVAAAAAGAPASPGRWRVAVGMAAVGPLAAGLLQALHLDPTGWGPLVRDHFHGRICSTLGNPNFLAGFLAGVIPFLAATGLGAPTGSLTRRVALGAAALAGAELLLTGSKGGLLGLAAMGTVTWLAARRAGLPGLPLPGGWRGPAVAVGALVALLALMPATVRQRLWPAGGAGGGALGIARNESVKFRAITWTATLGMARTAPVLGLGPGRFQVVYPRFRPPEIIRMFGQHSYMTDHPENLTLEIAAELGVAGLGAWLWLLAAAAARQVRRLDDADPGERRLAVAGLGGLAGLLVTNSFGVDIHYGATGALGAVLVGLAFRRPAPAAGGRHPGGILLALVLGLGWVRVYASDAALARALAFSGEGTWEVAVPWYRTAVRLNPANVMARYFGGSALLDRGRPDDLPEVRRLFDGVAREAPDYVLINYKYWLLENRAGNAAAAGAALERQIALDPLAATFYLERGRKAMDEGRWEDARADFRTAIEVEPASAVGYQYLGNLAVVRGRFAEALSVYHDGLVRHPDSVELHYNAAVAAFKSGRTAVARAEALEVLRLDPGHAQARLILAKVAR